MIIVSGCPRSGTSLTMDILREALGEDRIIGSKFPRENKDELKEEHAAKMLELFGEKKTAAIQYSISKQEEKNSQMENSHDMNPNGFWECEYSVRGIVRHAGNHERLKELLENGKDTVCKVVSQGLLTSDPAFIDKVIFLVRNPVSVAKSQVKLTRQTPFGVMSDAGNTDPHGLGEIFETDMYMNVTTQAARWLLRMPDIPVLLVEYEQLIANPEGEIRDILDFIGEGDYSKAVGVVDKSLQRSADTEVPEGQEWGEALHVHDLLRKQDFEEIIEYMSDPKRALNMKRSRWYCPRSGETVNHHDCTLCRTNPVVQENKRRRALSVGIIYMEEPCLFECGMDITMPEDEVKTIEDSIYNNSWSRININAVQIINKNQCEMES